MRMVQIFVATAVIALTASTSSAFAWSCLAVARNGAEGWSYNYPNRGGAINRALSECYARGRGCHVVRCNPNG